MSFLVQEKNNLLAYILFFFPF